MKSLLRDRELLLDKVSSLLYSLLDPKYSISSSQQALNNVKNNQVLYLRLGFPEIRLSESAKNHEDLAWFFLQLCLLHPCRPWNHNAMQIYLTRRETFAFLSLSRKRILKSCSLASYFSGSLALPTPAGAESGPRQVPRSLHGLFSKQIQVKTTSKMCWRKKNLGEMNSVQLTLNSTPVRPNRIVTFLAW